MAAAVDRVSDSGAAINERECVPAMEALRGYLAHPDDPGGTARQLSEGARADLCLLDRPLEQALQDLRSVRVSHTFITGDCVYDSSANTSSVCSPR